jgi:hypothetical protein
MGRVRHLITLEPFALDTDVRLVHAWLLSIRLVRGRNGLSDTGSS